MSDGWLKTTVGEYSPFVYGKAIKKDDQRTTGIPVYGSNGIYTYSDSALVQQHAVIIGRKGSVGKVHLSTEKCWISDTAFYVIKDSLDESYFVYYLLSSLGLENMNTDAAVPGLNRDNAHRLEIKIPNSIEKRTNLVEPLIKLDQKIHLNNQINQTLESIAQALFKSWFVDFEPVRAKIVAKQEGNDPELAAMCVISGKSEVELHQMAEDDFAELQATAALFPDEFVESELGEVPKGWTLTLLKDVTTELRRGLSPKYTEEPNGAIVINQKCIRNHTINFSLARKHDSSKRKIDGRELQIGDVLVNSTGVGTLGRIASVRYLDSITVVDSHVTVVRANDKKVSRAYLQGLLLENEKFIEASGAGTTGQTELRKEVLQDIKFPNPAVALHQQFDSIISLYTTNFTEPLSYQDSAFLKLPKFP